MFSEESKLINRFEIFLLIFISIQPVIDVLTTLWMNTLHKDATIGVFVRFFVMFLCLIYILFSQRKTGYRFMIIYLFSLGIALAFNIGSNYFVKENFHLMDEVKYLAKISYATILLFTYLILFTSLSKRKDVYSLFKRYVLYAILIIDAVMVISIATSTSLKSYNYLKSGYTGWFSAGNEIGAILAITFPITIIYAISKTTSAKLFYYWIPVVFTGYSLLMIGTKVGYGALMIGLVISLVMCILTSAMKKREKNSKHFFINGMISLVVLAGFIVATPFAPVYKNTYQHFQLLGINLNSNDSKEPSDSKNKHKHKDRLSKIDKDQVENLILSSRNDYLGLQQKQFKNAPIIQKAFGMGYGGNYKKTPKMIEMDFYDLFYSLGIVGFIIYILPFAYFLLSIGVHFIRNFRTLFTPIHILFLTSLFLGLGISYSAGHVLTAPAVSIYLSILIAYLMVVSKGKDVTVSK